MRTNKDLRACIDDLKSLLARDVEPEQKQALEFALRRLRELARKKSPSRVEVFRTVREIAASLIKLIR